NLKPHAFLHPGALSTRVQRLAFIGWDPWNQALLTEAVRRWRRSDAWHKGGKLPVVIAHPDEATVKVEWKPFREAHRTLKETCDVKLTSTVDLRPHLDEHTLLFISM